MINQPLSADALAAIPRLLNFLALSERLKTEMRHSWLSDGQRESVAEHCWHMALMALLLHRYLAHPVDLDRSLRLILVHDLVEALVGDIPFFETGDRKAMKRQREQEAILEIADRLGGDLGPEIKALWDEFEDRQTPEARFAGALDHLEVQVQHNLADLSTWEPVEHELVYWKMDRPCEHDPFLKAFAQAVAGQAETKMRDGGVDIATVRARVAMRA